jgi:hypothetical protein
MLDVAIGGLLAVQPVVSVIAGATKPSGNRERRQPRAVGAVRQQLAELFTF